MDLGPIEPPDWLQKSQLMSDLHNKILKEKIPVIGLAPECTEIHETEYASTFIKRMDGMFFRIDWGRKPVKEERDLVFSLIKKEYPEITNEIEDSAIEKYPILESENNQNMFTLSPSLGYYWPNVWFIGRPGKSANFEDIDLYEIDRLVFEDSLDHGIKARVYRHGLVLFDFTNWEKERNNPKVSENSDEDFTCSVSLKMNRVQILNAHLICLYNSIYRHYFFLIPKMFITHQKTISSNTFFDDNKDQLSFTSSETMMGSQLHSHYSKDYKITSSRETLYNETVKWMTEFHSRFLISKDVLKESFQNLSYLLNHSSEHTFSLLDFLAQACKNFEDHNYSQSLFFSWAIIERILRTQWLKYVISKKGIKTTNTDGMEVCLINSKRQKELIEDSNITASVITKILLSLEILPLKFYDRTNAVRKSRNDWLHDLQPIAYDQAYDAIELAQDLLEEFENIHLKIPVGRQLLI